jgi:hypothetical protein
MKNYEILASNWALLAVCTSSITYSRQSSCADQDHGAGADVDQPSGPVQHLLIGGGKPGTL